MKSQQQVARWLPRAHEECLVPVCNALDPELMNRIFHNREALPYLNSGAYRIISQLPSRYPDLGSPSARKESELKISFVNWVGACVPQSPTKPSLRSHSLATCFGSLLSPSTSLHMADMASVVIFPASWFRISPIPGVLSSNSDLTTGAAP